MLPPQPRALAGPVMQGPLRRLGLPLDPGLGHGPRPLNDAAVSGAHKTPHDRAARAAAGGAGGLYRFQGGALDPGDAPAAAWLGKPDGIDYAAFEARLRAWTDGARVGLWRRQMVLGPAPEFCLLVPDGFRPPADAADRVIRRRIVG